MATERQIEDALMTHPYIATVKGDHSPDGTEADVYVRSAGDAKELVRRLGGQGVIDKVPGFRQWIARIPLHHDGRR